MKALKKLLAAALVAALPLAGFAQTPPADPAKPAEGTGPAQPPAATAAPAPETPAAPAAPAKPPPAPASKITPYGFILANAYFDSTGFGQADYTDFVVQDSATNSGQFVMRASQSRFGLRFDLGTEPMTGAVLKGLVEVDFAGAFVSNANTSWEAPLMRLRHAWGSATWKDLGNLTLMAGQEASVVQPLFAVSLAAVQKPRFWRAGNLWRRTPQVRLSGDLGTDLGVTWAVGVLQPTDAEKGGSPDTDPSTGAGTRSRMPQFEGRVAGVYRPAGKKMLEVGLSGRVGKERYTTAAAETDLDSFVAALDAQLLMPFVEVRAEGFMAEGGEDYSTLAPGVWRPGSATPAPGNLGAPEVFASQGGWAQINVIPVPWLNVFAGYGFEDPDEDDLGATTPALANFRTKNQHISGGVMLNIGKSWKAALEFTQVTTSYANAAGNESDEDGYQTALSTQFIF